MTSSLQPTDSTERISIVGQVGALCFPVWINRHAARLGLTIQSLSQRATHIDFLLSGPPDLLDAMVLGCSLGPKEVWVDTIHRYPALQP
jgi:hypothetical protein